MKRNHPAFFLWKFKGGITIARKKQNSTSINEDIRYPQVRLVDAEGEMRGVVNTDEALDEAYENNMDLVLVSDNPKNPVARIMDYSKYQFEQNKREREARKNQKRIQVKEVQLKLTTEEHDFNVKVRNAHRFLTNEDRVKVVIRFRGREMTYPEQGYEVMEDFADACAALGKVDRRPIMEGRHMTMYLAPLSEKEKNEYEERMAAQERYAEEDE